MKKFSKIKLFFLIALLAAPLMVFQVYSYGIINIKVILPVNNLMSQNEQEEFNMEHNALYRLVTNRIAPEVQKGISTSRESAVIRLQVEIHEKNIERIVTQNFRFNSASNSFDKSLSDIPFYTPINKHIILEQKDITVSSDHDTQVAIRAGANVAGGDSSVILYYDLSGSLTTDHVPL